MSKAATSEQSSSPVLKRAKLLTTEAVAEMLSVPVGTLRYWRSAGLGPAWIKLEGSIRYALEDILDYIRCNRRTPSVRAYMEEEDAV